MGTSKGKRRQRPATARRKAAGGQGKPATEPPRPGGAEVAPRALHQAQETGGSPARNAAGVQFIEVTPSLAVADVSRSRRFYEKLGFRVTAHLPPTGSPEWVRFERDAVGIMVWNQVMAPPEVLAAMGQVRGAGNTIYITVSDVDRLARELQERGVSSVHPVETMPDGVREFSIVDPDGFLIAFATRLDPVPTAEKG